MNEKKQNYIACGVFNGRDISVPGHGSYHAARVYALLKGWTEIEILRS